MSLRRPSGSPPKPADIDRVVAGAVGPRRRLCARIGRDSSGSGGYVVSDSKPNDRRIAIQLRTGIRSSVTSVLLPPRRNGSSATASWQISFTTRIRSEQFLVGQPLHLRWRRSRSRPGSRIARQVGSGSLCASANGTSVEDSEVCFTLASARRRGLLEPCIASLRPVVAASTRRAPSRRPGRDACVIEVPPGAAPPPRGVVWRPAARAATDAALSTLDLSEAFQVRPPTQPDRPVNVHYQRLTCCVNGLQGSGPPPAAGRFSAAMTAGRLSSPRHRAAPACQRTEGPAAPSASSHANPFTCGG
jgi:hypothetical protein